MTIRARFFLTFGAILLIIGTLLGLQYRAAIEEKYYLDRVFWARGQVIALQELTLAMNRYMKTVSSMLVQGGKAYPTERIEVAAQAVEEKFSAVERLLPAKVAFLRSADVDEEAEEGSHFDTLRALYAKLSAGIIPLRRMSLEGKAAEAMHSFHSGIEQDVAGEFFRLVEKWTVEEEQEMLVVQDGLDRLLARDNLTLISLAALALLVVLSMSVTLIHPILKSLGKLLQGTERIGAGDLEAEVLLDGKDELALLAGSFNRMARNLHESMVSRAYLDNILNSMADTLIVVDPGGAIVSINEAAGRLLGYDSAELAGQPFGRICPADTFKGLGRAAVVKNEERVYEAKDGRRIPMLFSRSVMEDAAGGLQGAVCVALDITARKEAEQSLRTALLEERRLAEELEKSRQEMEEKNKALNEAYAELKSAQSQMLQKEKMASIGQLAAGVAHEINNPIGFVSSNLNTLAKYIDRFTEFIEAQARALDGCGNPETSAELDALRKRLKVDYILGDARDLTVESLDGTDRVNKIVQGLKNFSRVEQAQYAEADINECLETTLNIVWNELKYKAEVKKEYSDLPPIKCYPQQLNQVFMNLLVNAVHAIEKQGVITIRTWHRDDSVFVSITDTGQGIPQENLDRLFEPFFTTKEVGQGTGLGLSIVYDIIKKHNGVITVASERGKGTTFTIRLPVVDD